MVLWVEHLWLLVLLVLFILEGVVFFAVGRQSAAVFTFAGTWVLLDEILVGFVRPVAHSSLEILVIIHHLSISLDVHLADLHSPLLLKLLLIQELLLLFFVK